MLAVAVPALAAADIPVRGQLLRLRAGDRERTRRSATLQVKDCAIAVPLPDPRVDGAAFVLHGGASAGQCFVSPSFRPRAGVRSTVTARAAAGATTIPAGAAAGHPTRAAASGASRRVGPRRSVAVRSVGRRAAAGHGHAARGRAALVCRLRGDGRTATGPGRFQARGRPRARGVSRCRRDRRRSQHPARTVLPGNRQLPLRRPRGAVLPVGRIRRLSRRLTLQEVREAQVPVLLAAAAVGLRRSVSGALRAREPGRRRDDPAPRPALELEVVPLSGGFRNMLRARLDHPLGRWTSSRRISARPSTARGRVRRGLPRGMRDGGRGDAARVPGGAGGAIGRGAPARRRRRRRGRFQRADRAASSIEQFAQARMDGRLSRRRQPRVRSRNRGGVHVGTDDDSLAPSSSRRRATRSSASTSSSCRRAPAAASSRPGDPDGDDTATGLFADRPNPFGAACGPAPAPICWPSDHVGVQLDLDCG